MKNRPRSVTVISWIFIAVGIIAVVYHLRRPTEEGLVGICLVRVLAVVGGVFMLYGFNWARWLLVVWMGYHVLISFFHSPLEVVLHSLLFGAIAYLLFRRQTSAYFQGTRPESGGPARERSC